jgi:hypothetical protein
LPILIFWFIFVLILKIQSSGGVGLNVSARVVVYLNTPQPKSNTMLSFKSYVMRTRMTLNLVRLFYCLTILSFIFFTFYACKKEKITSNNIKISPFENKLKSFNWDQNEIKFFQINPKIERTFDNEAYPPLLVDAYNRLAEENEQHSFVNPIIENIGKPIWTKSFLYSNRQTQDKLVLIPLVPDTGTAVKGFISLFKRGGTNTFVINGVTKTNLLETEKGNPWQKSVYTKWMLEYDNMLFGVTDQALKTAFCEYESKMPTSNPDQPTLNSFMPPPSECEDESTDLGCCEWRVLEVCKDKQNNNIWYNLDGPSPNVCQYFDGDHDNDNIPDAQDPDYQEWALGFLDFWDTYGDDTIDGEDILNGEAEDLEALFEWLNNLLENFGNDFGDIIDWFDGQWGDFSDWWEDLWNGEPECPYESGGGLVVADDRTVTCEVFYVLDCGSGNTGPNWYDTFEEVVPCPECPVYQDIFRDRLYNLWVEGGGTDLNEFSGLYDLSQTWECNAYSPCFEECIKENFYEFYFNLAPPENAISFPQALDECFLPASECPTCFYTVVLYVEQPFPGTRELVDWYINPSGGLGSSGRNTGHTFMALNQFDPNISLIEPIKSRVFGFYPPETPWGQEAVAGTFYDENGNSLANISVTYNISQLQYEEIRHQLSLYGNTYQVQHLNCSTIPVNILRSVGFNIQTVSRHHTLMGTIDVNPADLGEDLRAFHPGGVFTSTPTHFHPPLSICQ